MTEHLHSHRVKTDERWNRQMNFRAEQRFPTRRPYDSFIWLLCGKWFLKCLSCEQWSFSSHLPQSYRFYTERFLSVFSTPSIFLSWRICLFLLQSASFSSLLSFNATCMVKNDPIDQPMRDGCSEQLLLDGWWKMDQRWRWSERRDLERPIKVSWEEMYRPSLFLLMSTPLRIHMICVSE